MQRDQDKLMTRVHQAIEVIKKGGMVIMVDDEDRENEGDLVLAAACVTPQAINFMAKEARGLICLTLEPQRVEHLKLPMMVDGNKRFPDQGTAFTVSIEARKGVSTGISAADRSHTIKVAIDDAATPDDLVIPGHIFPLRARQGGVLERAGHTEGSVDLAKLAGFSGAGVICEIMNDDGTMARMPDLDVFAAKHNLPIVAIADLIQYRLLHESMVEELARSTIQTTSGHCEAVVFRNTVDGREHLALIKGQDFQENTVDVRVHTQHPLIDVFADRQLGPGYRLQSGLDLLAGHERAVLVYLSRPQSWLKEIELLKHIGDQPSSDVPNGKKTDFRLYGTGAQIIRALGIRRMRVHTASPMVLKGLSGFGLEIVENPIIPKTP